MQELNVFTITSAIADPVRLSVMMYLVRGSASVTELLNKLDVSQSNLSNHLAVLKNAGLIKSSPLGRQKIYELANPEAGQLIELLLNLQPPSAKTGKATKPIQHARTCYDHLAGKLGVALFKTLMHDGAIIYPAGTAVNEKQLLSTIILPGPNAETVFAKLGVDLPAIKNSRHKFAYGCMDWTERTPHLAGALGAALCGSFFEKRWIARRDRSRTVALTSEGAQALKNLFGLDIANLA
jgi:DNA-binding transcriptional ArsR family regulator